MSDPKTLLQLAGANLEPAKLAAAAVVLIDMQNEYLQGPLAVGNAGAAIAQAQNLLEKARNADCPIIHIAHRGRAGGLFDRAAKRGRIVDELHPNENESTIEKELPNAFAGTGLQDRLTGCGRKEIILCGFMTHMCVSSTARAALDLGFRVTIDADGCATRDLPDGCGGVFTADTIHNVTLAALSDRFAVIARDHIWG